MRLTLPIVVAAVLLTAIFIDIVAAGVKISARHNFFYAPPVSGVTVAVPDSIGDIPPDLLPQ